MYLLVQMVGQELRAEAPAFGAGERSLGPAQLELRADWDKGWPVATGAMVSGAGVEEGYDA